MFFVVLQQGKVTALNTINEILTTANSEIPVCNSFAMILNGVIGSFRNLHSS